MQRSWTICMTVVAALAGGGCSTTAQAPPPTYQPGQGAIGIEIVIRPPLLGPPYAAESVYFAKADEQGAPDLSTLYLSNHAAAGRAYLLNVPPGRYVAVAGAFKVMGSSYVSYFPGEMVVQSVTEVRQRQLGFAGHYVLDSAIGVCPDKADALQLRVARVVLPGMPKCGVLRMALHEAVSNPIVVIGNSMIVLGPSTVHYGGILKQAQRDDAAKREFSQAAQSDLRDAGWDWP